MRTKTLILSAVACAFGMAAATAQTVYSVNVVGYVNVPIPTGFSMIANPLKAGTNTVSALIPTPPGGTQVYKWTGSGFTSQLFDDLDGAWTPANVTISLNPGEGVFIKNTSTSAFTNTFVGEVDAGTNLTVTIPNGFSIVSSRVPQAGTVVELGFPNIPGATIYKYVNAGNGTGQYVGALFDDLDNVWTPSAPQIGVGESFWVKNPGAQQTWTRSYTVQ